MKKIAIFTIMAVLAFGAVHTAYADETVMPCGGLEISESREAEPVRLPDGMLEDALPGEVSAFAAEEAPDWLDNKNLPCYEYIKQQYPPVYAEIYKRIYNTMYNYGASHSTRTLKYDVSGIEEPYFLVTDLSDCLTLHEVIGSSVLEPDSGKKVYQDIYTVIKAVIYDNPQFYFASSKINQVFFDENLVCAGFSLKNEFCTGEAIVTQNAAITQTVKEYDAAVSDCYDSNYKMEKAIHDKMVLENNYTLTDFETKEPLDTFYSHSIIGILDKQYEGAVCEGYAKAAQLLFNRYGIPSYYLQGHAYQRQADGTYRDMGGHAWNSVMLDDGEYHGLDVTLDDTVMTGSGGNRISIMSYRFFNAPYSQFYNGEFRHEPNLTMYPDVMPELSDNENFYNNIYDNSVTPGNYTIINGNRVYPPPQVSILAHRSFYAPSDTSVPVRIPADDNNAAFAANDDLKNVIVSGSKFIQMGNTTGNMQYVDAGTKVLYAKGNGSVTFLTERATQVYFTAQTNAGKVEVFADGVKIEEREGSSNKMYLGYDIPSGRHLLTVKHSGDGENFLLYNMKVHPFADVDGNETIDLLDAIAFANLTYIPGTGNNTDYEKYDADMNNVVDDNDLKVILRDIAMHS